MKILITCNFQGSSVFLKFKNVLIQKILFSYSNYSIGKFDNFFMLKD